jgi:hypothetical protein
MFFPAVIVNTPGGFWRIAERFLDDSVTAEEPPAAKRLDLFPSPF